MTDAEETANGGQALSEQEREHAHNAFQEFKKGNYVSCLQHLNKLDNRNSDYKVVHNKAVAEYYKSDLKKTDQFKKALNGVFSQAKIRPEVIDDVEQCVAQYNLAVLLYHQQQYAAALRIANRLLSFIEPMDDSLSYRVCLLLVELHIATFQPEKALNLINYIENQIINSEVPLLLSGDREIKILKKDSKDKKKLDSATEIFQSKLLQYQTRCNLMIHDLKSAKRDIILVNGGETANLCLKANYEYLRGNQQQAIHFLQSMPPHQLDYKQCGESSTVLFYNNMGVIHHALGKHHLAVHYIQRAIKENDNNINSLPKPDPNEPLSGRPLFTLGGSRKHELMLNLGVALLYAGRAAHAFDCFVMAVQRYHRNPRIWLRLAECCIQVHKNNNSVDFDLKRQSNIVKEQIGNGKHRKIILASNLSKDKKYSAESQSYAVPVPTLEFAMLCLRNALLLLPTEVTSSVSPPTTLSGPAGPPPPSGPSVAPSAVASQKEIENLRKSVLTAGAYVSLCLGDYVTTLEYSKKLLEQNELSGIHRLLGHLYAAEALVLMNKISEAIEHLNVELFRDISLDTDNSSNADMSNEKSTEYLVSTKPPTQWFPNNMETVQSLIKYNLAVALVYRGDYERASETLKQVWMSKSASCQVPIHVVMLVLYVELQIGHAELARSLIKQHCLKFRP